MKKNFSEELALLIEQAHQAGYIYACWCDGANVSNEVYHKFKDNLNITIEQFLEKYK